MTKYTKKILCYMALLATYGLLAQTIAAQTDDFDNDALWFFPEDKHSSADPYQFNDQPRTRDLKLPTWFKPSFLNLQEDIKEARNTGKLGLIVYFGQKNCAYCEALLDINFKQRKDIVAYTQKFFDLVAINIWGDLEVTTPEGQTLTEKQYADLKKTNFTPSLLFYNTWGQEVFRMRGYYPPYRFRAGLDYVVGEYYRKELFRHYLERAEPPLVFEEDDLNFHEMFSPPPYFLDRSRVKAQRPLAVFFEQSKCHACDVLHSGPLKNTELLEHLDKMDVVQLDMWKNTPLITPKGQKTTAKAWADNLKLFYTPTLIFFDEQGEEIIRVDSTVRLYRLSRVVQYVLSKDYQRYPIFQRWHTDQVQQH